MAIDKHAVFEAAMKFIRELIRDSKERYDYESWSLKIFEEMYMREYDANVPIQHGLFRLFLDFLGGMFRSVRGNVVLHDLGRSDREVTDLINGASDFEVKYFDTHLFSVKRSNGCVSSYILLRGEGMYGKDGDETVKEEDLFDLTGCLKQVLDGEMSDESGNGVQNRVIKQYVDSLIREISGRMVQPDWNVTEGTSPAFIRNKPVALTWRPSVDENGDLSWLASLDDREPPETVNIKGPKGDKGDQGEAGVQGVPGSAGVKGEKGDPGAVGAKGDKGEKGDSGSAGVKGDKGDQGIPGAIGAKGDPGIQGVPGPAGTKGDKGDPGIAGQNGYVNVIKSPTEPADHTLGTIWIKTNG